jgi:PAS domain S-box-containing protein
MAVAATADFVYTFDLEGRFLYANPALHNLLQRAPGEMVGLNFHDLGYPEPLATTLQAQIQEVIDTNGTVRAETPFGEGYYEYIFVPILEEDGEVAAVAGTTRDITERRRTEVALLESQADSHRLLAELRAEREKLEGLFQHAPAFMATLAGPEFVFEFANEDYYRLIGHRNIIGKRVLDVVPELESQGFIGFLEGVYATGEAFVGRGVPISFVRQDGEEEKLFLDFSFQAVHDAEGEITGILVHGMDMTEQHLARQAMERMNEDLEARVDERTRQFLVANRELEGFTYSVSHDLRAPLRAIISSSMILLEDFGPQLNASARHELERQASAAKRLAVLIDDLLKLSRLARLELHRGQVDLSALASAAARDLSGQHHTDQCEFRIQEGMVALGDPASLQLVLMNLMENACKFSKNSGLVEVGQTGNVFWVRDHGVGFEMQYSHKLFLPFERLVTDAEFPGTGIGLANVKRVVERHGGRVWGEGVPGEGATFSFTLGPSDLGDGAGPIDAAAV